MGRSRLHLLLILNQTCSRILRIVLRPGAYLVDTIPWLGHLPCNIDVGPSFVKYVLENVELHDLTETRMAFLAGAFFTAGLKLLSQYARC